VHLPLDRLCIVQDDMGDAGTLSQVGKMDKIYNGAYLTIIAAAKDEMYDKGPDFEWPTPTLLEQIQTIYLLTRDGRGRNCGSHELAVCHAFSLSVGDARLDVPRADFV
jgi:hypothetical protein